MKGCLRVFPVLLCLFLWGTCFSMHIVKAKGEIHEGRAECVIELQTGRILYESHGDLRLPMASTTKILTAITAIEMAEDLEEIIEIPAEAVGIEGASVYLQCAEVYTVEELLYGLLLRSGNDCAVALALHFGGDISTFCAQMNLTAQKAGALNSNFVNPHGLPAKNHVTTARDLCYIARYAMKNPTFRKIVATKYYEPRNWANKNKMLHNCEGGIGIKTGYTKEAGRCLVSAAKRGNMTVISTVLNCPSMYERSIQLIEDAFKTYDYVPLLTAGTVLSVQGNKGKVIDNYFYPISEGEKTQLEIRTTPFNYPKMEKIVGQFGIYLSKRLLFSGNLYKL